MYEKNTGGHLLQALRKYGIPETIAGSVIIEKDNLITYGGKPFANWKYFDELEQPLFRFVNPVYMQQPIQGGPEGYKAMFRLSLSVHGTPAFEINGHNATERLHELIRYTMLSNDTRMPGYKLTQEAGAFFQGGSENPDGQWIYIEFWKAKGAQAWLDYLNELYTPILNEGHKRSSETRTYQGSWHHDVIRYQDAEGTVEIKINTGKSEHLAELKILGEVQISGATGVIRFMLPEDQIGIVLMPGEYQYF